MNEELESVIEEEIVAPQEEAREDKPVETLRQTIEKARESTVDKEEPKEAKAKPVKAKGERVRDETGKFAPKEEIAEKVEAPVVQAAPIPQSYGAAVKSQWAKLPPDIQKDLTERDQAFHRELTKHDEDRNFGKQMKDVVTPYIAQIRAEGAEPAQAVGNLLNMAHVLRVGSPQQKSELLLRTAQTFGIDLRQALQVQQAQPQLPPQVQNVLQEVQGIKQRLEQQETLKKQQEDNEVQSQIKAFGADPKNVHFEAVRPHMASLLSSGLARDLQDAYDQAVYANPHTRSSLLEARAQDEQRVANTKAKAEAAKKAGSSIKGSPGITATKNGQIKGLSLRETIRAARAEHLDS